MLNNNITKNISAIADFNAKVEYRTAQFQRKIQEDKNSYVYAYKRFPFDSTVDQDMGAMIKLKRVSFLEYEIENESAVRLMETNKLNIFDILDKRSGINVYGSTGDALMFKRLKKAILQYPEVKKEELLTADLLVNERVNLKARHQDKIIVSVTVGETSMPYFLNPQTKVLDRISDNLPDLMIDGKKVTDMSSDKLFELFQEKNNQGIKVAVLFDKQKDVDGLMPSTDKPQQNVTTLKIKRG